MEHDGRRRRRRRRLRRQLGLEFGDALIPYYERGLHIILNLRVCDQWSMMGDGDDDGDGYGDN